jgi:hypothetical protein
MSSPSLIGATGLIEQPGSPQEVITDVGRTLTRTFVFAGTGTPTHPAIGSAYSGLVLKEISDTRNTANGKRMVVYTYGEPYADQISVPDYKLSEVEQEYDTNMISIPIEQHPNYQESWKTTKPGVTDYLSPQPIMRVTDYDTYLFANTGGVGRRGQDGFTTYWLKTGITCRKIGVARNGGSPTAVYQRVQTYQYAENGWDANIYG